MELSVGDRLAVLSILPKEGDLTTLKVVRDLKDRLGFTEDEHKLLNFRKEEEMLHWNNNVGTKEIEIGEKAQDVIVDAFKALEKQKKLRLEFLPLYERFIGIGEG